MASHKEGARKRYYLSLACNVCMAVFIALAVQKLGGPQYLAFKLSHKDDQTGVSVGRLEHLRMIDAAPAPGHVVFVGDSITEMVNWPEVFGSEKFVNRGIGGDTTGRILDRIDAIAEARPRKLFLMAGVNDLVTSTPDEVVSRYLEIIHRVRAKSPDTLIYVQSTLNVNNAVRNTGRNNEAIRGLNRALEAMCNREGAQWINIAGVMTDADGSLSNRYTYDGLHLNGPGIKTWTDHLRQFATL